MNHTPRVKKAIQFAARKHLGHVRRESEPLPYITHLFSTALLVAEDSHASEAVVIAALLHDAIEDTDATAEEIRAAFGERVAALVLEVTEPRQEGGRPLEWKERKKRYLAQIELGSDEALLIAVADKVDNIESKLEAFATEGPALLERFRAAPAQYLWYHGAVLNMAKRRLPRHPLTKRLEEVHARERDALARVL